MALLATKGNEDARSSGAGAPARGPAPSPVHRPPGRQGGRVFNGAVSPKRLSTRLLGCDRYFVDFSFTTVFAIGKRHGLFSAARRQCHYNGVPIGGVLNGKINLGYLIFLAATAALGGLLFGFDIAIITGAGPFLTQRFQLNDLSLGWAFSSLLFGCAIGSTVAGRLTNRYGRRNILLWVAALFFTTSIATGVAPSFTTFVLARFIGGLAVGGASILSPMYVAEVSPPSLRGRMGTLYQLSIVVGILMSYCINYLLRNAGAANWRWMFITGVLPSAIFFLLLLRAPETPRYLFLAGREREGLAILERIAGRASAESEAVEIRASLAQKRHAWLDLLRPGIRRAVVVGFVLPSWCTSPGSTPSSTTLPPSCAPPAGSSMPRCFPPSSWGSIIWYSPWCRSG